MNTAPCSLQQRHLTTSQSHNPVPITCVENLLELLNLKTYYNVLLVDI